jgi:hypothetical protein
LPFKTPVNDSTEQYDEKAAGIMVCVWAISEGSIAIDLKRVLNIDKAVLRFEIFKSER